MIVFVRDNHVEQANKILKRKMHKAGIYKEMRFRKHFEKPCELRARMLSEKRKKINKFLRKRMERDGF